MKLRLSDFKEKDFEINWDKEVENQLNKLKEKRDYFFANKAALKYEDKFKIKKDLKKKGELLKDWIRNRFSRDKAHEIRVQIDKICDLEK